MLAEAGSGRNSLDSAGGAAGPSLQVSFFTDLVRELPDLGEEFAIDLLTSAMPALNGSFGGRALPSFGLELPPPPPVNNAPIYNIRRY